MPADLTTVRSVALSLPGVAEQVCHGTPAFYVRRKLLARLQEDRETLSIACSRADRDAWIDQHSDVFSVTDHFRNYDYILMSLPAANPRLVSTMFEAAWRQKASKKEVARFDSLPA